MTSQEEAGRWFAIQRRGVMTLEERVAYEAWHSQTENRAAMAEMKALWDSLDEVKWAGETVSLSRAPQRMSRFVVAAVCVMSLGIGAMSYIGNGAFWTKLDWTDR